MSHICFRGQAPSHTPTGLGAVSVTCTCSRILQALDCQAPGGVVARHIGPVTHNFCVAQVGNGQELDGAVDAHWRGCQEGVLSAEGPKGWVTIDIVVPSGGLEAGQGGAVEAARVDIACRNKQETATA